MHMPGFTADSALKSCVHFHPIVQPMDRNVTDSVIAQIGCHRGCCLDSGDCDTTCCFSDKWHLECNGGKANAVCD